MPSYRLALFPEDGACLLAELHRVGEQLCFPPRMAELWARWQKQVMDRKGDTLLLTRVQLGAGV